MVGQIGGFFCFTPLSWQGLSSTLPPYNFQSSYKLACDRTSDPNMKGHGVGLLLDLPLKS
jgi:hypothetical protein